MTDATPVLDISTVAPVRPTIRIKTEENPDGRLYELAVFDDLTLHDQQFLYSRGNQLEELLETRDLDQDGRDQLSLIFDRMLQIIVLELEDEVLAKLSGGQKIQVIEAFTTASPEIARRVEALKAAKQNPTSGS